MKKIIIIITCVIGTIMLFTCICFGIENKAIAYEEAIENTDGNIRVEEKRRFDLIPNLVECVKEYDKHEYETLMGIVEKRTNNTTDGFNINEVKTILNAVAEAYPDLKSQKNYQELMNELSITENKISEMRKFYNQQVTNYKRYTRQFPSKQILSLVGYNVLDYERLEFDNISNDAPKNLFE